ncbi:MAG: DUF4911 domain-containing protein [Deltaproteobacteria bacterium]|nr:MAG: DUF4911 domain-containing protein [Deltaproteobacteria bacterium]
MPDGVKKKMVRGPDREFERVCVQVDRRWIADIRFQLEAWEGVGFVRTLDRAAAVLEFCYPPSQRALALRLLNWFSQEYGARPASAPAGVEPI